MAIGKGLEDHRDHLIAACDAGQFIREQLKVYGDWKQDEYDEVFARVREMEEHLIAMRKAMSDWDTLGYNIGVPRSVRNWADNA